MRNFVLISFLFLFFSSINNIVTCQENYHQEINKLLKSDSTLDKAEAKINDNIKKFPKDAELYVMKGNVFYLKFAYSQAQISIGANCDESIYNSSIGYIDEPQITIPLDVADSIIKYFQMANDFDKKREDIYLGIAHVLSQSCQADKVINYLPTVKANIEIFDGTPYDLADYARNIKNRGRFEDGMRVYKKISELFPESTGIINDIGAEYYIEGKTDSAKVYFDIISNKDNLDEPTLSTLFTFYSGLEDYNVAMKVLKMKSLLLKNEDYLLYEGLLALCSGKNYKEALSKFLKNHSEEAQGVHLAELILEKDFAKKKEYFEKCRKENVSDGYKLLIYKYFMDMQGNPMPGFYYAEALTYSNRFSDAIATYEKIDITKMDSTEKENYYFYYSWALHKSGNVEKSVKNWEKLLESKEIYYQSAACYFAGQYYLGKGNKTKAKELFSKVADKPTESKYATYCSNLLRDL